VIGPKVKAWRSEKYRRYVASHDCFECGLSGHSQAAHANYGKGRGLKTDDSLCFPLCATLPMRVGCHDQHDQLIDMTLDERREREAIYVAQMQGIADREGWTLGGGKGRAAPASDGLPVLDGAEAA
jgi:hypothetical protein